MTAYAVFIKEKTHDQAELDTYTKMVGASMAGRAMTPLAAYGKQEVLEGTPMEGIVILAFPTMEDAKAWYDSPAYVEARQHRFKGADYRAVIVQGL